MLYAVICTDKPDSLALRMANRPEHVAYLQSLGDRLVIAGPFTEPDGKTMNGSLIVVEAGSLEAARTIARRRSVRQGRPVRLGRGPPLAVDHQQSRRGGVSAALDPPWPIGCSNRSPRAWSWDQQKKEGAKGAEWDGVRNYQARNNMRAMKTRRSRLLLSFRRGQSRGRHRQGGEGSAPGLRPTDRQWECVDVAAVADLPKPVTLAAIKATKLKDMVLARVSRLSVQPV